MARMVIHLNPDGVNGGVKVYGDVPEGLQIVVAHGTDGEVVGTHGFTHDIQVEGYAGHYYAVCGCGWESDVYFDLEAAARIDGEEHVDDLS